MFLNLIKTFRLPLIGITLLAGGPVLANSPREKLYQAIERVDLAAVTALVEKHHAHPDVFQVNKPRDRRAFGRTTAGHRETPLTFAVEKGSPPIVNYLLAHRALLKLDVNQPNKYGFNAFTKILHGFRTPPIEMVENLLTEGAQFSLQDILLAITNYPNSQLFNRMIRAYAWERHTPALHPLVWLMENLVSEKFLMEYIEQSLPDEQVNGTYRSPRSRVSYPLVQYLIHKERYAAASSLIKRGAVVAEAQLESLFRWALINLHEKAILNLLNSPSLHKYIKDVSIDEHHTLLTYAAQARMTHLAAFLLQHGSEVLQPSPEGHYALALAKKSGHRSMIDLLMKATNKVHLRGMFEDVKVALESTDQKPCVAAPAGARPTDAPSFSLLMDAERRLALRTFREVEGEDATTDPILCCTCFDPIPRGAPKIKLCSKEPCEISGDPRYNLCQSCFRERLDQLIKEKDFPISFCHQCESEMPVVPAEDIVGRTPELRAQRAQAYQTGTLLAYHKSLFPEAVQCAGLDCTRRHLPSTVSPQTGFIHCACMTVTCPTCKDSHWGVSCEQHKKDKVGDDAIERIKHDRFTQSSMRPCPYCYGLVQKIDACDHMPKCRKKPGCQKWDWKFGRRIGPVHYSKDDGTEPRQYLIPGDMHPATGEVCTKYEELPQGRLQ